jgi:DNA repair exonuclease SbcCD ATPase subunit
MNKAYLVAPLVGMLIFGSIYSKYARLHTARVAEAHQLEAMTRAEKKAADEAAKATALEAARISQVRRSEERVEKERMERLQKQTRLALEERLIHAKTDVARLKSVVAGVRSEIEAMTTAVARCERQARQLQQRDESIVERLKRAEANRDALVRLLDRIATAEERRATSLPTSRKPSFDRG